MGGMKIDVTGENRHSPAKLNILFPQGLTGSLFGAIL
jgi:hypothetical protein